MEDIRLKDMIIAFFTCLVLISVIGSILIRSYAGNELIFKPKSEERQQSSATIYGDTIEGVHKGGTLSNFAKDMPIGTLFLNKEKINTSKVGSSGYVLNTNGNSNIQKYHYNGLSQDLVAYKGPNGKGIPKNSNGYVTNTGISSSSTAEERTKFTMKFEDAVITQSSEKKDFLITISNIHITNARDETVPILAGWLGSAVANRPLDSKGEAMPSSPNAVSMKCDISFSVLNKDGTPLSGESILFETQDLDVSDASRLGDDKMYYPKINDDRYPSTYGNMSAYNTDYRESLLILKGALCDAYIPSTNWLEVKKIGQGNYANGLRFSAYGKNSDNYTLNTGFLTVVDSADTKFRWYGSSSGTSLSTGLFTSAANHAITASSSNGGKIRTDFNFNTLTTVITDSDDSPTQSFRHNFMDGVDVNYIMEAKENYKLQNITIDQKEFTPSDFSTIENGKTDQDITVNKDDKSYKFIVSKDDYGNITKAIYTFEDNNKNHEISVAWETIPASLIIKYKEKDSGTELASSVTKNGVVGEEYNTESDKKEIQNYVFVEDSGNTTGTYTIESSVTPIEVIYYYKLADYQYKIEYYYDGQRDDTKTEQSQAQYGSKIESYAHKYKDGYKFEKDEGLPLTISNDISKNIIKVYYIKRNDLTYKVYYKEEETEIELAPAKEKQNQVFGTIVTENAIDIDGYAKVNPTNANIEITTGQNEHTFYYRKRTDFNYKVNYLEKGTNLVIKTQKTEENQQLGKVIRSEDEIVPIDGYNYDSADKESITIEPGSNVINLFYTKRNDLTYKVYYKEEETEIELAPVKERENQIFGTVVTENAIDIDGYTKVNPTSANITITTGQNEHTFYYKKRTDLSYKVNYLEKGTNKVLKTAKVVPNVSYNDVIRATDEVEPISKYNYDSSDKETLTIGLDNSQNVINLYYTKKDASLVVKYVDEITNQEISTRTTQQGKVDDEYTTTAKEIPDYVLTRDSGNTTGNLKEEEIIVIYYYKHESTGVVVNHLDVKTNLSVADQETKSGIEGDSYSTHEKDIEGYDLVTDRYPENATGTMTKELTIVNYYYIKKTKVTAKYIDKNSNEEIADSEIINGHEGDNYNTETKNIPSYVLVEEPINKEGTMTAEPIEVIYYYIQTSVGVVEKHIDEFTNELLGSETYQGNEGDSYTTSAKTFEGYELDNEKLPNNATGTMTKDVIEVKYYYNYKTRVVVKYIDKATGEEIVPEIIRPGYVGDEYQTEKKEYDEDKEETLPFKDYDLVEEPTNKTGTMTKEPITVIYYYAHNSAGVVVKHIDVKTNKEIAEQDKTKGHEGDDYTTHEKNIEGYDLVTERYPENATGKMTKEEAVVNYYYIKKAKVTVKYIDKITGRELTPNIEIKGHEGDDYETEEKSFDGYTLEKVPENKEGKIGPEDKTVIYYYAHNSAGVKVNHYDVITGNKLTEEEIIEGHEGDDYVTKEKEIKGYEIVKDRYPENAKGKMKKEETKVNYYYIQKAKVIVKYIDKNTGEEIEKEEIIEGYIGDKYETKEKKIEKYELEKEVYPNNTKGIMTKEDIEVIYYYKKGTEVIAKYIDRVTGKEISSYGRIKGYKGEEYETKDKNIDNYILIEEPKNKKGEMTDDKIEVVYYYRKAEFNLSIDKTIKEIQVNGKTKKINKNIAKFEVNRKRIKNTEVKVIYSIKVTNDGELAGKTTIEENIPKGMTMVEKENKEWNIKGRKATITTDTIKPGEIVEYIVVLTWDNSNSNFGTKKNIAKIVDTKNAAGFEEKSLEDNEDDAQFIISVSTGVKTAVRTAGLATIVLSAIGVCIVAVKRKIKE